MVFQDGLAIEVRRRGGLQDGLAIEVRRRGGLPGWSGY